MVDSEGMTVGLCSTSKEMLMVLAPPDTEQTYTPESDLSTRIRERVVPFCTTELPIIISGLKKTI